MSEYVFHAEAEWTGDSEAIGTLRTPAGLHSPIAIPREFGGPGDASNPEELLLGALCACYAMTLAYLSETKKLPLKAHNVLAKGHLRRDPTSKRLYFSEIHLFIRLVPTPDASPEDITSLIAIAEEAKHACVVSNALNPDIKLIVHPSVARTPSEETRGP